MKIHKEFEQNTDEWFAWRGGKISSSHAKELVGFKDMLKAELVKEAIKYADDETDEKTIEKMKVADIEKFILFHEPEFDKRKMVYKANKTVEYKMLAHYLSYGDAPEEDPRERGHRLEPEARQVYSEIIGLPIDELGGISREDEERIIASPDGFIKVGDKYKIGWECKALAGWKHMQIWQEDTVLKEHMEQVLQYFVVNDDCEAVHYSSYCPEITTHPIHTVVITRAEYQKEIEFMIEIQKQFWKEHDLRIEKLQF